MTESNILLSKCLKKIERKLNWVASEQWQQKHFESLSELIFEKNKVRLSPLTLKRLWGKTKYDSNPSASTLDALARFLDYENWIDYQSHQKRKGIPLRFPFLKSKLHRGKPTRHSIETKFQFRGIPIAIGTGY